MEHASLLAGYTMQILRSLPFLTELKLVMDWTFVQTSLDLFQWFKLEDINYGCY